jgi:hypothetical protein
VEQDTSEQASVKLFSIRRLPHSLGCVIEPELEEEADMIVGEAVVDRLAFTTVRDEAGRAEQGELMTDRRLTCAQDRAYIADAELAAGEGAQYPQPRDVGKHLEQLAEFVEQFGIDGRCARGHDSIRVHLKG